MIFEVSDSTDESDDLWFIKPADSEDQSKFTLEELLERSKQMRKRYSMKEEEDTAEESFVRPIDIQPFEFKDPTALDIIPIEYPSAIMDSITTEALPFDISQHLLTSSTYQTALYSPDTLTIDATLVFSLLHDCISDPTEEKLNIIESLLPLIPTHSLSFNNWMFAFQQSLEQSNQVLSMVLAFANPLIYEEEQNVLFDLSLVLAGAMLSSSVSTSTLFQHIRKNFQTTIELACFDHETLIHLSHIIRRLSSTLHRSSIISLSTYISLTPSCAEFTKVIALDLAFECFSLGEASENSFSTILNFFQRLKESNGRKLKMGELEGASFSAGICMLERFIAASVLTKTIQASELDELASAMKINFESQNSIDYMSLKEQLHVTRTHFELISQEILQPKKSIFE